MHEVSKPLFSACPCGTTGRPPSSLVQALLLSLASAFFLLVTAYNEGRSALSLLSLPFALTLDGQLTCQESS